jgi:hypothetical protein
VGVVARLTIVLCLLLAGCGAEERPAAAPSPSTSLVIDVDADGDGPAAAEQTRCAGGGCAWVPRQAFKPVNRRQVCTDIFGGPQTATVEGTVDGKAVSSKFSRQNGCEIARWNMAAPLLGRVP